ncbi:MAG: phage tail length tape measure family protein [Halothiobacillaceae bacterium]
MAEQTIGTARIDITASAEGVEAAAAKAKRSISDLSKDAQLQYDRLTAAERRRVDALNRQVDTLGMTRAEQLAYNASLRTSGPLHDALIQKLKQQEAAQKTANAAMLAGGLSAKEMEWAMRGVPAQITDIVTSLQGGQRPLTVFIQQGGQLKDMFGGVVPAARALTTTLIGMINPYTVLAAAAAGLAVAYHQGSAELDEFNRHLTMTGGALGMSASQVSMLAVQMDRLSGITRGGAVRALTEVAASGKIAADQIGMVAEVALRSSQLLGRETADVVEEFAKLAGEPSKAAAELNEKYNFLTTSVYQQIRALEEQGRTQDAARLAADELGRVTTERLSEVERSLGSVEKAWKFVKDQAKDAWDAMLNVGRPDTLQDQLKEAVERLEALRVLSRTSVVGDPFGRVEEQERRVAAIRAQIDSEQEAIGLDQARAEIRKSFIEAEQRWQAQTLEFLSKRDRMEKEIEQTQKDALRLGIEGKELNDRIAAIREKYTEKAKSGISTTQTELARLNALIEAEKQRETALHSLGAAQGSLNEGEKLAIQYAERIKLATDEKTKAQLQANKALAEQYGALKRANDQFDAQRKAQESTIEAVRKQTDSLRDQIDTYGLGRVAVEEMILARREEQLLMTDPAVSDATIDGLKREIAARKELLRAMRTKEALDAQLREWQNWEREVDRIFDRVGQSLTDAIFEGGKSGRDLLKDIFKSLTFNVLINPVMNQMQGWVTNQLGGMFGYQNPQQQQGGGLIGTLQNVSSAYQGVTKAVSGLNSLISGGSAIIAAPSALASLSTTIGASTFATTSFAAGLSGGALVPGLGVGIGGGGVGVAGAAAGSGGLMAGLSTAAPWIAGGLAVASALGLFDDREPTTRRGQRTAVGLYGGEYQTIATDSRQAANTDAVIRNMMEEATRNVDRLFQAVGVDAAIDSLYALTESSIKGDRQGVASGGTLRIDDQLRQFGQEWASDMTIRGFGGWSEAEMIPRLAMDLQVSMLEAFQRVAEADQLPSVLADMIEGVYLRGLDEAQLGDLATRFNAVIEQVGAFQVAVEMLPFAQLRDLTFDVAANIIQFAGGLENLDAGMTSYFQNFYSDAERLEWATDQMGAAFENLGLSMPDVAQGADAAKAAYRDLVESLDMNTESGQEAYAVLMTLSGGFAELATGMEQLNPVIEEVVDTVDHLGIAISELSRRAAGAERALQLSLSGGQLADRLGGMLGLSPVFAMRREQELWATIGQGSYEQQLSMSQELTDLVLTRIDAEKQANQARLTTLRQELTTYRSLQSIGASLQNYLTSLESSALAPYTLGEKVGNAEAELTRLVQAARGGDETALRQVQGALQNALTLWRDYGASGVQSQDAYHRLTGIVGDLAGQAVSEAEAQLMQLELQAESLESISGISETSLAQLRDLYALTSAATDAAHEQYQRELDSATSELAQLERLGLDTERLHDIADLLGQLPASIAAQLQTGTMGYMASNPDVMGAFEQSGSGNASAFAMQHYYDYGMLEGREFNGSRGEKYLLSNPDVMAAFFEHGANMTAEAFARDHYEQYGKYEGRSFAVGTPYVTHDQLAGIHRGEIIIDPRSSDILRRYGIGVQSSGGDSAELKALRQEVARLAQVVEQMGQAQVTATHQAAERSADKITAGVGQAVERRGRDDLNARNAKRVGVLA